MNSFLFIIILALTHVLASKSLVLESVPFFWEWDQNENTSWDYPAFTKIFFDLSRHSLLFRSLLCKSFYTWKRFKFHLYVGKNSHRTANELIFFIIILDPSIAKPSCFHVVRRRISAIFLRMRPKWKYLLRLPCLYKDLICKSF